MWVDSWAAAARCGALTETGRLGVGSRILCTFKHQMLGHPTWS